MGENEKPEGGQFYIDGQPWDGIIHDELITLPERQEDFSFEKPESVTLNFELSPETINALVETLNKAVDIAIQNLIAFAEAVAEISQKTREHVTTVMEGIADAVLYANNDNPKWWHLYKHAKKARTRKKYRNKLLRQYLKKLEAERVEEELT